MRAVTVDSGAGPTGTGVLDAVAALPGPPLSVARVTP